MSSHSLSHLFHTAPATCPACGEPTFRHALRGLTSEAAALLLVADDTEVCDVCADRAERELDDAEEALALDEDETFAAICDERAASYRSHAMQHQGVELVARAA